MLKGCLLLCGASETVFTSDGCLIKIPCERSTAIWTLFRECDFGQITLSSIIQGLNDLGYHVTRSAHDDLVTDTNIQSGDFISVVKRGITDRHTPDENWL